MMQRKNKSIYTIIKQFIQNSFAYAVPVFFQQFIVFPLIANKLGIELNGRFLADIALNYFVINITVTVLVNVRLLQNQQYEELNQKGDFNILVLIFAAVNTLTVIGGSIFYANGQLSLPDIIMSVVVILLFTYHDYIVVQYRAELRFRDILTNNLLLCGGYLVGLAVMFWMLPCWQIVFIIPYTITAIYDYCHTTYIKEPLRITPLFRKTVKQYFLLMFSSVLISLVTYGDRLVLYPLMDGETVSVFSSAQLAGKLLQMISTPVTTFLLAHLVQKKAEKISLRWWYPVAGLGACVVLYLFCVLFSTPVLHLLYPQWVDRSLRYVPLTALNGVINTVIILLNTVVLRFCKPKWQLIKSAVYLVAYMGFSFVLLYFWDLTGFCIGNVAASVVHLACLVFVLMKEKVFVVASGLRVDQSVHEE